MMKYLILSLLMATSLFGFSTNEKFDLGNEFYSNEEFDSAIVAYESVLEEDQYSFEVFYNLGNAYFRKNQLGKAILNWEKARKISPSNSMVIENLNHAYTLTRDKFDVEIKSEGFIKSAIYERGPNFWSVLAIVMSFLLAIGLFLFFTSKNDTVHQISFYFSIVAFVALIGFTVSASTQKSYFQEENKAIILSPRVKVRVAPTQNSEESFPLHEGTKVELVGEDEEWVEIVVNKDSRGWVLKDEIGLI